MILLELACSSCGQRFRSGVPLARAHVEGVKIRVLEICPACGVAGDYTGEDYLDPDLPAAGHPIPAEGLSFPPARTPEENR